jgi:hypothetical protein
MSTGLVDRPWVRRGLAVVVILALLSPAFAWAAGAVDYSGSEAKAHPFQGCG